MKKTGERYAPDQRLAQAFDFTADDLAANRAGFMAWGQAWGLGRIGQRWFRVMIVLARTFGLQPRREDVLNFCGRARLQHIVKATNEPRASARPIVEHYTVYFASVELTFTLNAAQYRVLAENIPYRVYYVTQPLAILSIERVEKC